MKKGLFALLVILSACAGQKPKYNTSAPAKMEFIPLQLQGANTPFFLTDYCTDVSKIKRVKAHNCCLVWDGKTDTAVISANEKVAGNRYIDFEENGQTYRIFTRAIMTRQHVLKLEDKGYETVAVKGTFNGWNTSAGAMKKVDNYWIVNLTLSPGAHQYVFVTNGKKEMPDPANKSSISNGMGGTNSLIPAPNMEPMRIVASETNGEITFIDETKQAIYWMALINNSPVEIELENGIATIEIEDIPMRKGNSHLRVWAYNLEGQAMETMIPLQDGKVVQDATQLPRMDMRASVIYNPMIDRFYNGNKANDKPLNLPEVNSKVDWMGGDIAGLTAKIEDGYFKGLGTNTLWISPIIKNPETPYGNWEKPKTKFSGYHGYWPVSSTLTEPRLCTEAELMEFIDVAHKNNINVLLDYVAHHIHIDHPTYKLQPSWYTPLYLPDGTKNTEKWDEHRLTTWFDDFLPTFNFANPDVLEQQTDSALYWIKKYPIDGFRHDATKHIPETFWRLLNKKLRTEIIEPSGRKIYQIGETYGSPQLINSYLGSGLLDAQFDFNLYDASVNAFKGQNQTFNELAAELKNSQLWYGDHHTMGNITGNQDRPRFISIADGSIMDGESTKQAGWDRKIEIRDEAFYDNLLGLICFNLAVPGVPVIYYGDEIGMPGANDPDNRRKMQFDSISRTQKDLRNNIAAAINLRRNQMPLCYGSTQILQQTNSTLVILRQYLNQIVVIAFNRSEKDIEIILPEAIKSQLKNRLFEAASEPGSPFIVPANRCDFYYN